MEKESKIKIIAGDRLTIEGLDKTCYKCGLKIKKNKTKWVKIGCIFSENEDIGFLKWVDMCMKCAEPFKKLVEK